MIPRLMFGCFAGIRSSEIERLTWENVRLDVGQLFMTKGKNKNSERYVTLTPPLLDWCKKMLDGGATGPVLKGFGSKDVYKIQKRLCKVAGVNIPYNALRHSFGSHHRFTAPAKVTRLLRWTITLPRSHSKHTDAQSPRYKLLRIGIFGHRKRPPSDKE